MGLPFKPQKTIVYNKHLPYRHSLDEEALKNLAEIKYNLSRAVLFQELVPGALIWFNRLDNYIRMYGHLYSKEDHVNFVRLAYQLMVQPGLEPQFINGISLILRKLLKKDELLSREDIQLDWRPLYEVIKKAKYSKLLPLGLVRYPHRLLDHVYMVVKHAKNYFSIDATKEMLIEWRPLLCPFDAVKANASFYFSKFLPTRLPKELHDQGFKMWFDELFEYWSHCTQNSPHVSEDYVKLFMDLAEDSLGYVDWQPHIPKIFNNFLCALNLPVTGTQPTYFKQLNVGLYAKWFVYMIGGKSNIVLDYLEQLFATLESFYHPSNHGRFSQPLQGFLFSLTENLIKRLNFERFAKPSWKNQMIPKEVKITDDEIERIVNILKDVSLLSVSSKTGSGRAAAVIQNLALLRADIILPPLYERTVEALETLVEPHQVTETLSCITSVSRVLVTGGDHFPTAPTLVMPLLYQVLPGIDPNDFRKSMMSFTLISSIIGLIPLVDCTPALNEGMEMTEVERDLCEASGQFEDFVLLFMDRCFCLIENSTTEGSSEPSNADAQIMSAQEGLIGMGLVSAVQSVLVQSSPKIFESVVEYIFTFVSTRVLEVNVAGKMIADVCRASVKANTKVTLKKLLPFVCSRVKVLASMEGAQDEEHVDGELLWYLEILSQMLQCDGSELVQYKEMLKEIIRLSIHLKNKKAYSRAGKLLKAVFCSCGDVFPLEWCSQPEGFEKPPTEHFYIRDWGKPGNLDNLGVKWHLPSKEELSFIDELMKEHLIAELDVIQKFMEGKTLTRDELHQRLQIIIVIVFGCGSVLPPLAGEERKDESEWFCPFSMVSRQKVLPVIHTKHLASFTPCISRNEIAMYIHKLLGYLLEKSVDDTKSLRFVSKIYSYLLRHHGVDRNEFNMRWKNAGSVKRALCDKLHGNKRHIRAILVERVRLQHDMRVLDRQSIRFTEMDRFLVDDLLLLATTDYAEVRMHSQQVLFSCIDMFDYCARYILPKLLENLKSDSDISHDKLKGTLYILQSPRMIHLVTHYMEVAAVAWPAIIAADHSEKPSIVGLLQKLSQKLTSKFDTLSFRRKVNDTCVMIADNMIKSEHPRCCTYTTDGAKDESEDHVVPSEQLIQLSKSQNLKNNETNERLYHELVDKLCAIILDPNLHWRPTETAVKMLCLLPFEEVKLPISGIRTLLKLLINDSKVLRTLSIKSMNCVLYQNRPEFSKKLVDLSQYGIDIARDDELLKLPSGCREDNNWLQYGETRRQMSQSDLDKCTFIDKTHWGFSAWPKDLQSYTSNTEVYLKTSQTFSEEQYIIFETVSSTDFIESFLKYLSIEDKKGEDRFKYSCYNFFKGIFRNYGCRNELMEKYGNVIKTFMEGNLESKHRCISEVIAGMIRGAKNWPYDHLKRLWSFICDLLQDILGTNVMPEMLRDWTVSLITATESLDPNRFHELYDMLLTNPLSGLGGAFGDSSRLYIIQNTLSQQEWRVAELYHKLLEYLKQHLSHQFKSVRDQIGASLAYVFMYDLQYACKSPTVSPRLATFIEELVKGMTKVSDAALRACQTHVDIKSIELDEVKNGLEEKERKEQDCYAKTVLNFLLRHSYSMQPITKELYTLIPLLFPLETREDDPEMVQLCKRTFGSLASKQIPIDIVDDALAAILKVCRSPSWNCRKTGLNYLKAMTFHNLFTLNSDNKHGEIKSLLLGCMKDEQLEVRELSSSIFSGLVHYGCVDVTKELLQSFLKLARKKMKKIRYGEQLSADDIKKNAQTLKLKHGGVLGLSACILAYPYQVPEWMPDILLHLGDYLHEAPQIQVTVKKTLSDFRRTHHDNWQSHREKFTSDQLSSLTDLLISPSYYA